MADLAYLATTVAFFAIMVAFVRVCERIVGTDDAVGTDVDTGGPNTVDTAEIEEVPA